VKKVSENAKEVFIVNDKPNIEGLIMAGAAGFKEVISKS